MTKEEALAIVMRAIDNLNQELDEPVSATPETSLFGSDAVIDSLSLVSLIVDVEAEASDTLDRAVSLTDDRAMSRQPSPFSTPDALADYLVELAGERA